MVMTLTTAVAIAVIGYPDTGIVIAALIAFYSAAAYGQLPLAFEANRGQTDAPVRFLARGPRQRLTAEQRVVPPVHRGASCHEGTVGRISLWH